MNYPYPMSIHDSAEAADHTISNVAAVIGIGQTDWVADHKSVREGKKPFDSYGYGATAFKRALDDAGISRSEIDGLVVGHNASFERAGEVYGVNARWGGQADAVQSVVTAVMAIKSGLAKVVAVVYGHDQRSAKVQYGGPEASGGDRHLSYVYHAPMGLTSQGALYGLMYRRHMELTGATEWDLGQVSVAQRQWASRNPRAILRKLITIDDYLASDYIAEPLHLYDYCMVNDGGVALIISETSHARCRHKRPVTIRAIGRADLHEQSATLKPRLIDFYHPAHRLVANQVYNAAGIGPKDIDAFYVYDSFSCHIPFALEGFGFCGVGESGRFIAEMGIGPGGRLPINTSGGQLSESNMQGWSHQLEAVRQLRGEAATPVLNCRHVQYVSDVVGKVFSIIYGVD